MSNFDFVGEGFGQVGASLKAAEKHIFSDIKVYAVNVRTALEEFVIHLIYFHYLEDQTDAPKLYKKNIERLRNKIDKEIYDKIRKIRSTINPGVHFNPEEIKEYDARLCLKFFYDILVDAVKIHINRDFVPPPYVEPVKPPEQELPATLDSSILEQYCKNVIDAFNNLSCPFLIFPNIPSIGESEEVGRSVGTLLANPLLVVTGQAGVGKSYLMQALQSLAAAVFLAGPDDRKIIKLLKRDEKQRKIPIWEVLKGADKEQWRLVPVILTLREYRCNDSVGIGHFLNLT
ncbi:MAG: DUF4145 domain-containing protein [Sedimentisphaerales bacterium]|nr:DUF4145 domain-containing protein [Sedimentisphaerales bacterium]